MLSTDVTSAPPVPLPCVIGAPPVPIPRVPIHIRSATPADLPFIDSLQKKHSKQLGFLKRAALEGKIAAGHVIVAEEVDSCELVVGSEDGGNVSPLSTTNRQLPTRPLGYIISQDRYLKRDDLGIVFQLCVAPDAQRKLVAATLLKAVFERAAYGCRLFCCWCAQDIEANRFWESMGFVPLAYRAGGTGKTRVARRVMREEEGPDFSSRDTHPATRDVRVHIFWQKRIREGDQETPWWFPFQTGGGMLGAERVVLPIPPGTHWSEAKPVLLPQESLVIGHSSLVKDRRRTTKRPIVTAPVAKMEPVTRLTGLRFVVVATPPPAAAALLPLALAGGAPVKRETKRKAKHDPKLLAGAREFRDRYLEEVNSGETGMLPTAKYDVSKTLSAVEGSRAIAGAPASKRIAASGSKVKRARALPGASVRNAA